MRVMTLLVYEPGIGTISYFPMRVAENVKVDAVFLMVLNIEIGWLLLIKPFLIWKLVLTCI